MTRFLFVRLVFDLTAAALLLFGLAYWWLGNVAHEVAGTAMFALLIVHNVFNRRWYATLPKTRREPRPLFNVAATALLLFGMLTLLITSVLISNALSGVLPPWGGFTVRQIHTFAGYWVLVIAAVHLGLRWPLLMGIARKLSGVTAPSSRRTFVLRVLVAALAACGVWSSFMLGLGAKLSMQMTLDWWNFEESVVGFFAHAIAIAALYIILTYYAAEIMRRWNRRAPANNAAARAR